MPPREVTDPNEKAALAKPKKSPGHPFQKVNLYVATGQFVQAVVVTSLVTGPAKMLLWGNRTFIHDENLSTTDALGYREEFMIVATHTLSDYNAMAREEFRL